MKDKRVKFAVLLAVFIIVVLLYGQYMSMENRRLSRDLARLNDRIRRIELDNNMQKIITLEGDKTLMKQKMIELQSDLVKARQEKNDCQKQLDLASPKPKVSKPAVKEKSKAQNRPASLATGNRGYITQ